MSWKGAARYMALAVRRAERQADRQGGQRGVPQRRSRRAQQDVADSAEAFETLIELLLSVHKGFSQKLDWLSLQQSQPPPKPQPSSEHEQAARAALEQHVPSLRDRLSGRAEERRLALQWRVAEAREEDHEHHRKVRKQYEKDLAAWRRLTTIADGILAGKPSAYMEALRKADPFAEIDEIPSQVEVSCKEGWYIEATARINGEETIPSRIRSLGDDGTERMEAIPQKRFRYLCREYACAVALRVARELFALLPVRTVFFHAVTELPNNPSGRLKEQTFLSVALCRETLEQCDFETADCSELISRFPHNMGFEATRGFSPVDRLRPRDLRPEDRSDHSTESTTNAASRGGRARRTGAQRDPGTVSPS